MTDATEIVKIPAHDRLDPITVHLRHYGENRGGLLVECFGQAWLCYWGNMGGPSVRRFLHGTSADYVANCLIAGRRGFITNKRTENREMEYLTRICAAILEHLTSHKAPETPTWSTRAHQRPAGWGLTRIDDQSISVAAPIDGPGIAIVRVDAGPLTERLLYRLAADLIKPRETT